MTTMSTSVKGRGRGSDARAPCHRAADRAHRIGCGVKVADISPDDGRTDSVGHAFVVRSLLQLLAGPRSDRGIVTVELVFGMLLVITATTVFGWAILLFGVQISAISTAENMARQAARGDQHGVAEAKKQAPQNARFAVDTSGSDVRVTVRVHARPSSTVPSVPIRAAAVAQKEPGEKGAR